MIHSRISKAPRPWAFARSSFSIRSSCAVNWRSWVCWPEASVRLVALQLVAEDADDVQHVGRARRAERNAGADDHGIARGREMVTQRHALGLGDHFLERAD